MIDVVRARRRSLSPSRVNDTDYFPFDGGLNLVDPPIKLRPGHLLAGKNYEVGVRGGYRSIRGYERFDGRLAPSEAVYWVLHYKDAGATPSGQAIIHQQNEGQGFSLFAVETQPVTVINAQVWSEDLTPARGWTEFNATIRPNQVSNPISEAVDAELLVENDQLTRHSMELATGKDPVPMVIWYSLFVRSAGRSRGRLRIEAQSNPANFAEVDFDILNRAIGDGREGGSFQVLRQYMVDAGRGWFRVGLQVSMDSTVLLTQRLLLADSGSSTTYRGDGSSGMAVWGWQIEFSNPDQIFPGDYVPTDSQARGNGRGYLVLSRLDRSFVDGGDLISNFMFARADGIERNRGAPTDELDAEYIQLAIEWQRSRILAVPGIGRILGTAVYRGRVYAIRNSTDGNTARMYRSSNGGWSQVSLGHKIRFRDGTVMIQENTAISGGSSGATANVRRVVVQTGTWDGGDATGYLVLSEVVGTFTANEDLQVTAATVAVASTGAQAQTLRPNGRFEFEVHNFYGHTNRQRLYGVDGENNAFEYQDDPGFFNLIETGMTDDRPTHLAVHSAQLWLSFRGGSLQKSSVGDPASFQVSLGAAEMSTGDEVTGFLPEVSGTLFVFSRNRTDYVMGTPESYELRAYNPEIGGMAYTIQALGRGIYLDDRGLSTLRATQSYGNFSYNSVSALVQPLLQQMKNRAVASMALMDDSIYRLFFDDGRFLSVTFQDQKIVGFTTCEYPAVVRCSYVGEDAEGNQMAVFGSDDGYVYRAESGTSFDGAPIETFCRLGYFFSRSPSRRKKYRRAQFDVDVDGAMLLNISVDYSFGDADDPAESVKQVRMDGTGGYWGSVIWGQFRWGEGSAPECIVKLEGAGINVGFLFTSNSTTSLPHTLQGVILHHSMRRINRGTSYA